MSKSFYGNGATPSTSSEKTTGYFSNAAAKTSSAVDAHFKVQDKIVTGPVEQGVPSGGRNNMLLVKASGDDFDTAWTNNLDDVVLDANLSGGYF